MIYHRFYFVWNDNKMKCDIIHAPIDNSQTKKVENITARTFIRRLAEITCESSNTMCKSQEIDDKISTFNVARQDEALHRFKQ